MRITRYLVILLLVYFIFLARLTSYPIRTWDESWYAADVYEMIHNHNYLVPYFNGSIDHVTTKPLLAVWIQVISVKLLGYNELAIRLPSAIAAILASFLVFFFLKKLGKPIWAWCSFLILITSFGFVHFHTARTGDTDSLLTLLSLLSNIFFFLFLQSNEKANRNIFLYFLFLGLAFGVKSIAPLLFVPGHLFLLFYTKKWEDVFKLKGTYLGAMAFLALGVFFIFSRQLNDPAYIGNIFKYDVARLQTSVESHKESFDFYFNNFLDFRFSIWCAVFVFSIILLFLHRKDRSLNLISVWSISLFVSQFFIISFASTKLYWYDMPLYPYMAILTGYSIFYFFSNTQLFNAKPIYQPFIYVLLFCIPIYYAIKHSQNNSMSPGEKREERISEYIFTKEKAGVNLNNYSIVSKEFISPLLFYKYKLQEKGQNINILDTINIKPFSKVIAKDSIIESYIQRKFDYTIADSFYEVTVFNIGRSK